MTKIHKLIYLLLLGMFLIPQAQAEWVDISPSVEITQSSKALDRVKRVLFSYVTVKNTSNEALVDPVRLVITNPSIPVLNQTGITENGYAYLQVAEGLAAGASTNVRVDFKLARVKLVFGVILENEIVQNDLELGTVKFIPGEKSRFYIYDDDNTEDNSLAGLEVIIPADALVAPEIIRVSKGSGYINTPDRESLSVSHVVKLEPAGLTFKKPVQLSIPFYATANAENLYIVRYSEDGIQDYIAPDYVDVENKLVYFRTEHFTEFQVKTKYISPFKTEDKAATEVVLKDIIESDLGLNYEQCSEGSNTTGGECYEYWKKALNTFIDEDKTTVYDFYLKYKKSKKVSDFIDNNEEINAYKYIFGELDSINETLLAPVKAIKLMDDLSGIVSFVGSGLKSWIGASEDGLFNQLKSVSTKLVAEKINLDISSDEGIVNIIYERADTDIFSVAAEAVSTLTDVNINYQIQNYFVARNAGLSHTYILEKITESKDKENIPIILTINSVDYTLYNGFFYLGSSYGSHEIAKDINKKQLLAMVANIEALYILNKAFDATEEKDLVNKLLQSSVWEAYTADTPWLNAEIVIENLKKDRFSRFEIYPGQKFEITYTVEEKGYPDTFGGVGTLIHYARNAGFIADTKEAKTVSDDGRINTFVYTMTASDSFSVTKGLDEFTLCFKALYQSKEIDECKKIEVVFINKEQLTANLDESKIILFEDKKDSSMLNIILLPTIYSDDREIDSNYACEVLMGSGVIDSREKVIPGNILGYFSDEDIATAVDYSNQKYGFCGQLKKDDLNNYVEKDLTVFIKPYVAEAELFKYEAEWSAFSLDSAIANYLRGERPNEQFSIAVKNSGGEILGENHPSILASIGVKFNFSVKPPVGVGYRILETDLDSDGKFELYKAGVELARTYNQAGVYDSIKIKIQTEVLGVFHEQTLIAKPLIVLGESISTENSPPEVDIAIISISGPNPLPGEKVGLRASVNDVDGITSIDWAVQSGGGEVLENNCCENENFFFNLPENSANQNVVVRVTAVDSYGASTVMEKVIAVASVVSIEAPKNLRATAKDGGIELTWDDVPNAQSYNLYFSTDKNNLSGRKSPVTSPYLLENLTNDTPYYFALTAEDIAGGESDFSNEVSATPKASSTVNLNDGLVAHYKFDENTIDSIGGNNNGSDTGIKYVAGISEQAISCDGVDDTVSQAVNLNFNSNKFSISLWVKSSDDRTDPVVQLHDESGDAFGAFQLAYGNGKAYLGLGSVGLSSVGERTVDIDTSKFNHLVGISDLEGLKLYINGKLVIKYDGANASDAKRLEICSYLYRDGSRAIADHHLKADIDEFRAYDRVLSQDEIQELYKLNNTTNSISTGKLNDTGITFGGLYDNGNNSDCSGISISEQDCSHGRDLTYNDDSDGHAGFSFTKLDANGDDLPASAAEWSCVRDNVTGLIWEKKTEDGGIHDKDNAYRWGGITALGSGTIGPYYPGWGVLVNGSNAETLCGFSDWRVPTAGELIGLTDFSRTYVTYISIDSYYFPNTASAVWSSLPDASYRYYAWFVNFIYGMIDYNWRDDALQVRLVRSGQ